MIICCGVLLKNINNEYLLVYGRKHGKWSFPKGHIENNETWTETAERELFEETNVKIQLSENCEKIRNGKVVYFIKDNFNHTECRLLPHDKNEISMCRFISLSELSKLKRHQVNRDVWDFINNNPKWNF